MTLDISKENPDLDAWFVSEILPLEGVLVRYLRRHWPEFSEVADLRQETYIRVYEAAKTKRPVPVKPFLLYVARNLIIDRVRRASVVPMVTIADSEWLTMSDHDPLPEERVAARQELLRMQEALE